MDGQIGSSARREEIIPNEIGEIGMNIINAQREEESERNVK
jgi:hypothetical protein